MFFLLNIKRVSIFQKIQILLSIGVFLLLILFLTLLIRMNSNTAFQLMSPRNKLRWTTDKEEG